MKDRTRDWCGEVFSPRESKTRFCSTTCFAESRTSGDELSVKQQVDRGFRRCFRLRGMKPPPISHTHIG